jgi:hypothetical protein
VIHPVLAAATTLPALPQRQPQQPQLLPLQLDLRLLLVHQLTMHSQLVLAPELLLLLTVVQLPAVVAQARA